MSRAKIKRKSTTIDMTAMCDVAFLLLSFFILTAKFKSAEAVPITIPTSVASKAAEQSTDAFIVSIDRLGKVYVEMSDSGIRSNIIGNMEVLKGMKLPPALRSQFLRTDVIGVPFASLPEYLSYTPQQQKALVLPGIPLDTTGGELKDWITAGLQAYNNNTNKIHFTIKGDNDAKYPVINNVLTAFKKNEVYKYKLQTSPQSVPAGSELYKKDLQGIKRDE
jgi:biopolymer transport protein ExbD